MDKNILIVDDNYDSRHILKKVLQAEGFTVYEAGDEKETFEMLGSYPVHLILLDIKLGTTSGFDVCRKIKNTMQYANIPIISISVSQLEEDIVKAIESGSTDFIGKPFNNRVLIAKIKAIIALKEKEEELRKNSEELIKLIKITANQKQLLTQEAEFSRDLNQFLDEDSKKAFIKEKLATFLGVKLFSIFVIDEESRKFRLFVSNHTGMDINLIVPIDSRSIMYEVLHTKKVVFCECFSKTRFLKSGRKKYTTDIVCTVPLLSGDRIIGVLNVNDPSFLDMKENDFKGRIMRISQHLAVSIHNTLLFEKVKDLSMRDSMTGLYNFRHFLETMRLEIEHAKRYNESLSCIMLDIDNFKEVNDTYGHQVGDMVLKELARSVSISVRASDIPARYGGDEFIVVLPKTDKKLALKLAQRLMNLFSDKDIRVPGGSGSLRVTLSVGISSFPEDTDNMDELMKKADAALYEAKKKGKNRIVAFGICE